MRAAIVLGAALAAALAGGCKVETEGAPCEVVAATDQCPSGQRCGTNLKCSEAAAACTPCVTGARGCNAAQNARGTCASSGPDDPCGTVVPDQDGGCGPLLCDASGVEPVCACRIPAGAVFWADPVAGETADAVPAPTGAEEPPACRFRTLKLAVAAAAQEVAGGAPSATVRAAGTPAFGAPVVFGAESGETFPVEVAPGVTVAAGGGDPDDWVIEGADPAARAIVSVAAGGALDGFTVRSAATAGDATRPAIELACASAASARLDHLRVDAFGWGFGIAVLGSCGFDATGTEVSRATTAALLVDAETTAVASSASGGKFFGSRYGVQVRSGTLTLSGAPPLEVGQSFEVASTLEIFENSDYGIYLDPTQAVEVTLSGVLVRDNAGTGIRLGNGLGGSSVAIRGCEIRSNRAESLSSIYGPSDDLRRAGGLILNGTSPALTFSRNLVRANGGDQVGIYSNTAWSLSGTSCPPTTSAADGNVFTCLDGSGGPFYAVYARSGVASQARYDYWDPAYPEVVNVAADDSVCAPPRDNGGEPVTLPACPAPPPAPQSLHRP
jgi:hypothetical protein